MTRKQRSETFLVEVLGAITKRYGTQVSWNARVLEVKWTRQIRPKDFELVARYGGLVAGRVRAVHAAGQVRVLPAPVVLLRLGRLVAA